MFNIRWSGVAALAAFIISLTLGFLVRAHVLVILLRAFGFAAAFFFLAALVWRLVNRYLPELLQSPLPQDIPLMQGFENGSRVNITVGDGEIPHDAAVPPETASGESVGNIVDLMRAGPSVRENTGPLPAAPPAQETAAPSEFQFTAPAAAEGMDQSPPARYTEEREGVSAAPNPVPTGGISGVSGLGDLSGGVESLPDLDALAGTFLSSGAAEEEAVSNPASSSGGEYRSKKGKEVGEDFNPKELASAIQTILKRD
ncbi:MAG: hypothetical protein LBD96_00750 [Treponema sp.]|nr:hypothetical protein [Treponema sp.]